jgi:NADPH:quinone reductase
MKAVLCKAFGPADSLVLEEVPSPTPGPDEVLITVHACGVNFFDGLMIEGKYQSKPPFPFSPGAEVSGVVKSVGDGVATLRPGMRVLAFTGHGGYAERVVARATQTFPIPDEMDDATAAAFPIVYATSLHALHDRGQLRPGETLLVLGAAGGVGLTAVELGKLIGARVIAAASTDDKLEICRQYGADELINYAKQDLRERLKQLTAGHGVDVVCDPVGGAFAEPAIRSLARNGRYLVIGFAAGEIPRIPLNLLLLKSAAAVGVFWGAFAQAEPARNTANVVQLLGWYRQGRLRPHLAGTHALENFSDAVALVMNRKVKGKVVLTTKNARRR